PVADARPIMHVDLDAFFVAVEQARNPDLLGKPVIVGGDPDGRGVAATASYEARVFGVRSGMALSTARRLCPQAVFLRGDFKEYQRVSDRFHAILRDYSPLVEPGGLDEAYLDITGCKPVIDAIAGPVASDTPEEIARAAAESLRRRVREELSLAASVGIASGKSLAKVASDAAKPDGLLLVPPGEEAAFLAPRPLRELPGLGPKAEAALLRLGVKTLGQVANMPAARLRSLFGGWGPALAERARGIDPAPVASGRDRVKSVSREGTFARDIDDAAVLRGSLRGYAESVGAELRRLGRRARCITLKLRYSDFTTISRSRTLSQPTFSDEEIYRTGAALLEQALERDGRAVRLLGLGTSNLGDDVVQLGLFGERELPAEELLHSIDRLREKYGYRALQTGRTFFDPYVSSPDWEPDRHTGLSSQVGLDSGD
ncbi:MAG: DNA polymerase IV, partial [Chloroflexi bacterium]|nr:DNA polymerase IV [Chloroflexota bacterium]